MKAQLGSLADSHIEFYGEVESIWTKYVEEMEKQGITSA
jgi:sorting nexin-4